MRFLRMLKTAVRDFLDDGAMRLAAAVSYYTALSLAPLLLLIVSVVGLVFGREAVSEQLITEMQNLVGQQGAEVARTVIQHSQNGKRGTIGIIVGLATLVLGATGVFLQLQEALNKVWEVTPDQKRGIKGVVLKRVISLAMVMGIGFLLLVSLVISAALTAANTYFQGKLPGAAWLWQAVNILVSLGLITVLFAMMFKYLPDTHVGWRDVWTGALITAVLFTLGKIGIGFYLGHSSVGSAYGAAGSFVALLVWVYYSAIILFFGAELTQVYAHQRGARIGGYSTSPEIAAKRGRPAHA